MTKIPSTNPSRKQQHIPKATANPGGLFHGRSFNELPPEGWIGTRQLLCVTSLSAATVARLVACGRFPPPLMRGRVRLYRVADVRMWLEAPASYHNGVYK